MSSHDIGKGLNNVVERVMDMYRDGRLKKETAKELMTVAKISVNFCDGNEYEALECMEATCGCCLRDGKPGEHLYSLADCDSIPGLIWKDIDTMLTEDRKDQDYNLSAVSYNVCEECLDKLFARYLPGESGEEVRRRLEEQMQYYIVEE